MKAESPSPFHWLLGVEGGLGVRTWVFSGTEGINAGRAEHQRLKDVRDPLVPAGAPVGPQCSMRGRASGYFS
jgi:hypothetical protein